MIEKDTIENKTDLFNQQLDNINDTTGHNIPCFGNVQLTAEEKDLLSLGPDFMVLDQISKLDLEIEIQTSDQIWMG